MGQQTKIKMSGQNANPSQIQSLKIFIKSICFVDKQLQHFARFQQNQIANKNKQLTTINSNIDVL